MVHVCLQFKSLLGLPCPRGLFDGCETKIQEVQILLWNCRMEVGLTTRNKSGLGREDVDNS